MIIKWMKRLKWMRISKYAIIICLLLSFIFAGFTVYGAKTGMFTIYLQQDGVSIAIYMEEDKSDMGTHLSVPTLDQMDNTTLDTIYYTGRDKIVKGLGSKNDNDYQMWLAFSFVLVNLSEEMVDYDMALSIVETRNGTFGGDVTSAMRILILEERNYTGEANSSYYAPETSEAQRKELFKQEIYAKPETLDDTELRAETDYTTIDFDSDVQIFSKRTVYGLDVAEEVKYTVVMWLEGWDPDCVNAILGGKIKMRMDIFAY